VPNNSYHSSGEQPDFEAMKQIFGAAEDGSQLVAALEQMRAINVVNFSVVGANVEGSKTDLTTGTVYYDNWPIIEMGFYGQMMLPTGEAMREEGTDLPIMAMCKLWITPDMADFLVEQVNRAHAYDSQGVADMDSGAIDVESVEGEDKGA
jgi:hypothetical protein